MNRGWTLLTLIAVVAVGQLWLGSDTVAGDAVQPKRTRVSLIGVERLAYGWDCVSHQCHEYYLVTLQEQCQGVDAKQPVLVSYYFKGGEPHPTREQLDKHRQWSMELRRFPECDATWAHFLKYNQFQLLDSSMSPVLKPERLLPCFAMTTGAFTPIQE